jgi:hypothetical protein
VWLQQCNVLYTFAMPSHLLVNQQSCFAIFGFAQRVLTTFVPFSRNHEKVRLHLMEENFAFVTNLQPSFI